MVTPNPKPGLLSLLVCLFVFLWPFTSPLAAKESWTEVKTPHFLVISNAGEHEGRRIGLQFEQVRAMFEQLYPKLRVDSGKETVVFALRNEDSLKLLIPSYGQNSKAMHIGGFYSPSYDKNFAVIRTDITNSKQLPFHSLYHEYTHAFFRYNFRGLPLWLDEGLAEFYGNTEIEGREARVGLANENQLRYLQGVQLLPIDQLVAIDRSSPLYATNEHAGIFYSESWALIHYFQVSDEMRQLDLINKFLAALHESDDPIAAARETFGDLKKLSQNLEGYTHLNAYHYVRVDLPQKLTQNDFTSRPMSQAEASLALADFLLRNRHLPEGLERLHEVEQSDPATPGFHSEMGHYHLLKADYANAEKELVLALQANPNDFFAHMDMAYIYLRRDGYTKDATPKIRAELEKALTVYPDFPAAHAFLSIAYAQEPDKNTDKAFQSAVRATKLEPGNLAYFIDVGKALLAAGRIPDAEKISDRASKAATNPSDRSMATAFAKLIDSKKHAGSQTSDSAKSAAMDAAADSTAAADPSSGSATRASHAEGKITEILCGHPPEVLLTLTTAGESLLLHVADISKIAIQDGNKPSDAAQSPCAKWKDRPASMDYRPVSSGMAKGEIQSISLGN